MKYIKTYEDATTKDEPQVGDYVLCKLKGTNSLKELKEYLSNNIGICTRIKKSSVDSLITYYTINFYGPISQRLSYNCFNGSNYRYFEKDELLFWSPNKEDCEAFLAANKYNL